MLPLEDDGLTGDDNILYIWDVINPFYFTIHWSRTNDDIQMYCPPSASLLTMFDMFSVSQTFSSFSSRMMYVSVISSPLVSCAQYLRHKDLRNIFYSCWLLKILVFQISHEYILLFFLTHNVWITNIERISSTRFTHTQFLCQKYLFLLLKLSRRSSTVIFLRLNAL